MALYLPNTSVPEVAIGRVAKAKAGGAAGDAGFWADFIVVDPQARMRISHLLSDRDQGESANHRGFPATRSRSRCASGPRAISCSSTPATSAAAASSSRPTIRADGRRGAGGDPAPGRACPVTTNGVVVHRQLAVGGKIPGAGVQFVDGSDGFRERIDRYMDSLLKD